MTNLDAALSFLKRAPQAHLFPAWWTGEKHIGHTQWSEENGTSNDPERIKQWATMYPYDHFCVDLRPAGKSDMSVIDVDNKNGKRGSAVLFDRALNGQTLPDTLTSATPSGGEHHISFGACSNTKGEIGVGIDTPVMVPLPGSFVAGKGEYKLLKDLPILPQTQWVIDCTEVAEYSYEHLEADVEPDLPENLIMAVNWLNLPTHDGGAPESIEHDNGDNSALQVSMGLWDRGISAQKSVELLLDHWNETKAKPSWPMADIQRFARSATRSANGPFGGHTAEAMFDPYEYPKSNDIILRASELDFATLKPREWLMYGRHVKKYVTLTAAPGGAGKSSLAILEGLSIASGKQLTYYPMRDIGAVWYYNTEDPVEEIKLRVAAASIHHGLTEQDRKLFYYSSGRSNPMVLVDKDRNQFIIKTEAIQFLIEGVRDRRAKLLMIDPFVRSHHLDENDNTGIDLVTQQLQKISEATGCSIHVNHHTSKGKEEHGNIEKARGASALASAARIAHTFYTMSAKESVNYGVSPEEAKWYARLDSAKYNLTPPDSTIHWYKHVSVDVIPGSDDSIGTLEMASLDRVGPEDLDDFIVEMAGRFVLVGETESLYHVAQNVAGLEMVGLGEKSIQRKLASLLESEIELKDGSILGTRTKSSEENKRKHTMYIYHI